MKNIVLLLLLIISTRSPAQTNDWMVLKKKDLTVKTYFSGNYIRFQLDNYQWIEGDIKFFRNDSIFLMQRREQVLYNAWGLPVRDTLDMGILAYGIKEIYAVPLEKTGVTIFEDGTLLQVIGAGYIALNAINSIALHDPFFAAENLAKVGVTAGVFMIGKVLQWNHPTKVILGKKYKLASIKVQIGY